MCVRRFIRAAGISECSAAAALSGIVSAMADLPLVDVATGLDGRHGACRRHRFFSPSSQRLLLAVCERSAACLRAAVYRAGGQLRDRAARGPVARGGRAGRGGARVCGSEGRLRGNVVAVQSECVDASACVDTQDAFEGVRAWVEELAGAEEQL